MFLIREQGKVIPHSIIRNYTPPFPTDWFNSVNTALSIAIIYNQGTKKLVIQLSKMNANEKSELQTSGIIKYG